MKKIQILALSAVTAIGTLAVSCEGGSNVSTNTPLKNQTDTLSYSYGVQMAESGLMQYLEQLKVVQDTAAFKMALQQQANAETDTTKKAALEAKISSSLDSLTKANASNLALFIKGLNESYETSSSDKDAYFNGLQLGNQLKKMSENFEKQVLDSGTHINKSAFLSGLVGSLKKEKNQVPNAKDIVEAKAMASQEKVMKIQEEELKKQYKTELEAGQKFLEENKSKEGIVTLPSGVQYKILKGGNGEKPSPTAHVKVNYKGTLIDGTIFDSNEGKAPVDLTLNQVIKGWTEALQLMPVGSKWKLFIPYNMGYGAQAAGSIPPFSTLVFEVELVSIDK